MAEMTSPRTPSPERSALLTSAITKVAAKPLKAMTPPPSGQNSRSTAARFTQPRMAPRTESSLASPPATLKSGPPITSVGLYGEVPSMDSVQEMDEDQLRRLVSELLPALGEARVTAAHSKLQHSMLTIESKEEKQRAEVEHEATRREVQVLQQQSPTLGSLSSPKSPHSIVQRNLHLALGHCRELQNDNTVLEKRLRSSKRLIKELSGENEALKDRVQLLRQRIKANRDHLNDMQSSGAISLNGTPMTEFGTPLLKGTPRTPAGSRAIRDIGSETMGSQGPFDSLLIAGQLLNGEATSVPGTPSPTKPRKAHPQHARGAHSLSSLPSTPNQLRPPTAQYGLPSVERSPRGSRVSFSAAGTPVVVDQPHDRNDRDSTISASEGEADPYNDEDLPGSQASQRATTMLRRSLGSQNDNMSGPMPNSGKLLQSKLLGQVRKPGIGRDETSLKRGSDVNIHDEVVRSSKKARLAEPRRGSVGLGIKDWPHVGH